MAEINLICIAPGIFKAATQEDLTNTKRFKVGDIANVKLTRTRNPKFHRKFFALLEVGYDAFEPVAEYKGELVKKNAERFREDVTILAGFYEMTVGLNGEPRAIAKSISFANMDDDEFEQLYSSVADVILGRVLTNYSRDDLDNVVQQVMGLV